MGGWLGVWLAAAALIAGCGRLDFDRTTQADDDDGGGGRRGGFSQLDAAGESTCGVFRGRGYCWGANDAGQLGLGDRKDRAVPTAVALPAGTVTQVDVGATHACALVDGAAWCWGAAALGDGITASSTVPIAVVGLPAPVTQISAGLDFTCAIANADVYCWGSDESDKLGNGASGDDPVPALIMEGPARAVSAGGDHACAVRDDGTAWCWGHNDGPGALGNGMATSYQPSPTQVVDRDRFSTVTTAGYHGCGIDEGAAFCWGTGESGELGNGASTSSARPVEVAGIQQMVTAIHTGGGPASPDATCALVRGELWCWGSGLWGRLGNRVADNLPAPAKVEGLGAEVVAHAVGWYHTCAVLGDGEAACWGRGERGELGDGASTTSFEPVRVQRPMPSD